MRVIKRKKGRQEYYYLQHSYRKDGKVVTAEKYLGREIPKNIEEIRRGLERESSKELYSKLEIIRRKFKKEWKGIPKSARESELKEIAIAFTYNTNAIEG